MFKKGERPPTRAQSTDESSRAPKSWAQHLEANADAVYRKLFSQARKGDSSAMRIIMGSLLPRQRVITFKLPAIESIDDTIVALKEIAAAVAAGTLSPDEGSCMSDIVTAFRGVYETVNLERRVIELETLIKSRLTNYG
jgi:hypothetical protein